MKSKKQEIKWHKLDNCAILFPIISNKSFTNVYRVSVTLKDRIEPKLLQKAVEEVLPYFKNFRVRLRRGVFWNYFELNEKTPIVTEERSFPCEYLDPHGNRYFLFRVTYFECRINVELFHAITDGNGAIDFLKAILYQYLSNKKQDDFSGKTELVIQRETTSFDLEDSYVKNYKKQQAAGYSKEKAFLIQGTRLPISVMGLIHGFVSVSELKQASKKYGASITQYCAAVLIWAIYKEYMNEKKHATPIIVNIPVNLRQFFKSSTMMNFFAVLLIGGKMERDNIPLQEIVQLVQGQFKEQITKENLERTIAYNVNMAKNKLIRILPLVVKNIGVKLVYEKNSRAYTTTLTNLGEIEVLEKYKEDVQYFAFFPSAAKEQTVKCGMCSFHGQVAFHFTSIIEENYVQRGFFRKLREDGVSVTIKTNNIIGDHGFFDAWGGGTL